MRRGAVATIIAVVGVALAGCGSSSTSTPSPTTTTTTTTTVTHAPASTAAPPLAPDDVNIVAAPAAIPLGSCHARHVTITDPQAWEPDPACTPGAH
jgi:hypothetical protein